jgi:hypothetical protein
MGEWAFYNVVLSLLPVPLIWLALWLINANRSLFLIIRDGQLCFYCTTLSATTLHELLLMRAQQPVGFPVAGLLFLMILSTFAYGVAVVSDNLSANIIEEWKLGIISVSTALTTTILVVITRWQFGML